MGVPVAVLYMLLSLHKECQANWTAPLYISGAILAGAIFQKNTFLKIGIVLGVSAWLLLFNIDFLPGIPQKYDPTLRLTGWKLLGEEVGGVKEEYQKDSPIFIFSDTYQIASELAFYTPEQPRTYNVNLGRRMNQYDIWGGFDKLTGNDGLYVKHRDQVIDPEIASAFSSWEKLPVVNIIKNGEIIHRYTIFLCREFKGIKGHGDESSY
jgi:undecaprenyl-diphosphatase